MQSDFCNYGILPDLVTETLSHGNIVADPMAESFVAVCDMRLKFHNLSAKLVCNFDE